MYPKDVRSWGNKGLLRTQDLVLTRGSSGDVEGKLRPERSSRNSPGQALVPAAILGFLSPG